MRPPKTITLSGRRVEMILQTPIAFDVGPDREVQGLHEGWQNVIRLDSTLAPDQMRSVAVHEIVHDLEGLVYLNLTEAQVTAFSTVLFAAIRDNPRLMSWLQEKK